MKLTDKLTKEQYRTHRRAIATAYRRRHGIAERKLLPCEERKERLRIRVNRKKATQRRSNPERFRARDSVYRNSNKDRINAKQRDTNKHVAKLLGFSRVPNEIPEALFEAKRLQLKIKRFIKGVAK